MSIREPVTGKEEQAELQALRDQAERDGQETADTVAALAGKLAEAGHPGTLARRAAAAGRRTVARNLPADPRARVAVAVGAPTALLALITAAVLLRRSLRS